MIDIRALIDTGLELAWSLAATALSSCTLKLGPNASVDVTTEAETITWASETELEALIYNKAQAKEQASNLDDRGADSRKWTASALLRQTDLPDGVVPANDSVLVEGSEVWHVTNVQHVPTNAIFILTLTK